MSDPFETSGTAGIATVTDAAIQLIAPVPSRIFNHLMVINNGAAPGFFKVGSGGKPVRLEQAIETFDNVVIENEEVFIQREASGTNMTNIFAVMW